MRGWPPVAAALPRRETPAAVHYIGQCPISSVDVTVPDPIPRSVTLQD
jgi:hypothetical protein